MTWIKSLARRLLAELVGPDPEPDRDSPVIGPDFDSGPDAFGSRLRDEIQKERVAQIALETMDENRKLRARLNQLASTSPGWVRVDELVEAIRNGFKIADSGQSIGIAIWVNGSIEFSVLQAPEDRPNGPG